jgi:nitroimidazol reductase NimA-like FMN-containing flavoprotein (pyridoxamine 5'-phosphate oxidase superfamily)
MRRKDKEMDDRAMIDSVIERAKVCHLGLCDDGIPYIVPMCFGYEDNTLFLHCAKEGRKIDFLKRNSTVCFEFETDCEVKIGDKPCSFSMRYRSVMGYGQASFVEDPEAKHKALEIIMRQYTQGQFSFPEEALGTIAIIKIRIAEITGKKSGY